MSPLSPLLAVLFLLSSVLSDQPAVAPQYEPPAAPASPSVDTYGTPQAQPTSNTDSYGPPQAPVSTDSYGSPAAPVGQQASPVSNQGYYYYYYPVRQGGAAAPQESDSGLLGGLLGGGLLSSLLGKELLVPAIAIAGLLVALAFGLSLTGAGRSFPSYSLLSEDNLVFAADMLRRAMDTYGN